MPDWLVAALESCICSGKGDDCSFSLYILPYLYYILFPLKKKKWEKVALEEYGRRTEPHVGNCGGPVLASSPEFRLRGRASL